MKKKALKGSTFSNDIRWPFWEIHKKKKVAATTATKINVIRFNVPSTVVNTNIESNFLKIVLNNVPHVEFLVSMIYHFLGYMIVTEVYDTYTNTLIEP